MPHKPSSQASLGCVLHNCHAQRLCDVLEQHNCAHAYESYGAEVEYSKLQLTFQSTTRTSVCDHDGTHHHPATTQTSCHDLLALGTWPSTCRQDDLRRPQHTAEFRPSLSRRPGIARKTKFHRSLSPLSLFGTTRTLASGQAPRNRAVIPSVLSLQFQAPVRSGRDVAGVDTPVRGGCCGRGARIARRCG